MNFKRKLFREGTPLNEALSGSVRRETRLKYLEFLTKLFVNILMDLETLQSCNGGQVIGDKHNYGMDLRRRVDGKKNRESGPTAGKVIAQREGCRDGSLTGTQNHLQ